MYVCKKCGSPDIQVAMWADPNTNHLLVDCEPIFDFNQAPEDVCVQWCNSCDEECEIIENKMKNKKLYGYHGTGKLIGKVVKVGKNEMSLQIVSYSNCHLRNGEIVGFTRTGVGEAWIDNHGKPWTSKP